MIELKNLRIDSPFKNLNGLEINFENSNGVTVLIGNNGSGKSNVLEAISSIFAGLYDNDSFNPVFKYEINYTKNDALINIKYDPTKSRNKYEKTISDDDPLPSRIISIYSGEELRMWNRYYFKFYEKFNRDVLSGASKYFENPNMEYLNKYHWNITLVTMLASYMDISDIIQNKKISYIAFHFKKHNIQNIDIYDKRSSNEVTLFAKSIYESSDLLETIKDTEIRAIPFYDFTELVRDTNIELYRKLTVSLLPKENNWKLIDKMEVFFEGDENEDSFSTEELSEGQKKQLLIKFATKILADENSILLLDEPDSHIHISNKEKIKDLLYEEKNKPFVQSIITTHSPTLTSTFSNENVFMLKKENKQVQIVDKEQQEIIKELFGEKFSPQVQNMFLASNKPIILLVEGKEDKIHLNNAFKHFKEDYPNQLDFDVFNMGSADNVEHFAKGLYGSEINTNKLYICILDNDTKGMEVCKELYIEFKNKLGYKVFMYPKKKINPNHDGGFTVENLFEPQLYEKAFKEALSEYHFEKKSIDSISKNLQTRAKGRLSGLSKDLNKEDFKNFKLVFDEISKCYINFLAEKTVQIAPAIEVIPVTVVQNEAVVQEEQVAENTNEEEEVVVVIPDEIKPPLTFTNLKNKRSGRTVTEKQHLTGKPTSIKKMYTLLKEEILEKDSSIVIDSKVEYIAFKRNKKNIFDIKIQDKKIILWVNKNKGEIPVQYSALFNDCSGKGHHGNGDYEKHFNSEAEVRGFIVVDVIDTILKL